MEFFHCSQQQLPFFDPLQSRRFSRWLVQLESGCLKVELEENVEMFLCWSCGRIGGLQVQTIQSQPAPEMKVSFSGPKLSHRLNDDVWVVAAARLERGQRSPLSRGSVFMKKPHWGARGNSDDLLLPMSHAVCVREREGLVSEWPLTLGYCKSNVWVFVSRQFV